MLISWFRDGFIADLEGKKLESVEITKKHKHTMIKRIWTSKVQTLENKTELLDELKKIDGSGDWIESTMKFCDAAHPANKKRVWDSYFNNEDPMHKNWGQSEFPDSMSGWAQASHIEFTEPMLNEFFDKIPAIFDKKAGKGHFISERAYWAYLAPTHKSDDEFIKKYEDMLLKTQKEDPDNSTFIKCMKGTISALKTIQQGREASQKYLD